MRRTASIAVLLAIWLVSLAALALGLDGLLGHPPFVPHALLAGAYFGAVSTVSLAEALGRRSSVAYSAPAPRLWPTCNSRARRDRLRLYDLLSCPLDAGPCQQERRRTNSASARTLEYPGRHTT